MTFYINRKILKNIPSISLLLLFIFISHEIVSAEGGPCKDYGDCDEFKYSLNDIDSLQRGASTYINYCYGCHSLQYQGGEGLLRIWKFQKIFFLKI